MKSDSKLYVFILVLYAVFCAAIVCANGTGLLDRLLFGAGK